MWLPFCFSVCKVPLWGKDCERYVEYVNRTSKNYFSSNGFLLRRQPRVSWMFHYERVPAFCRRYSIHCFSPAFLMPEGPIFCAKLLLQWVSLGISISRISTSTTTNTGNKNPVDFKLTLSKARAYDQSKPDFRQKLFTSDICLFVLPQMLSEVVPFLQPLTWSLLVCFMRP